MLLAGHSKNGLPDRHLHESFIQVCVSCYLLMGVEWRTDGVQIQRSGETFCDTVALRLPLYQLLRRHICLVMCGICPHCVDHFFSV